MPPPALAAARLPARPVRVATYNVLAQCLAKSSYFPYVTGNALKAKHRWPALQRVIASLDADVLLLSEVDQLEDFQAFFASSGYGLVWKRRGGKQYGNAIAYRTAVFELVRTAALELNDLADAVATGVPGTAAWHVVNGADDGADAVAARFRKDCVAVYAALAFKQQQQQQQPGADEAAPPASASPAAAPAPSSPSPLTAGLLCACTHLYWDPAMAVVRSAQAAAVLAGAADFAAAVAGSGRSGSGSGGSLWHTVVSGDFNSMPGTDSHRLLIRQPLPVAQAAAAAAAAAAGGSSSGGARLVWDTYTTGTPAPQPTTGGAKAAGSSTSTPAATPSGDSPAASATPTPSAAAAAAPPLPPPSPERLAYLGRLSDFVAAAVYRSCAEWAIPGVAPDGACAVPASSSSVDALAATTGVIVPAAPSSAFAAADGPVLVSAYAQAAQRGMALAIDDGDEAATAAGGVASDASPGRQQVRLRPSGLPRTTLQPKHGAPAIALPLPAVVATDADGDGHDTLPATRGDGTTVRVALPPGTRLALDVLAEPVMTTMTASFTEALDYIFYQRAATATDGSGGAVLRSELQLLDVAPLPTAADVTSDGAVAAPSARHPSDHFPLVATLQLRLQTEAETAPGH